MQWTIPNLDRLFRKAVAATRCRTALVTPWEPVRPPGRMIRSAFADVVIRLFHAEQATGRMCRLMAGRTGTPLADILLQFQAGDETHHAELYESYLSRIGDIRLMDTRLSEALDAMCETNLGPEAVLDHISADGSAPYQIVLANGGSTHGTVSIARGHDAQVVSSPPGRGHQIAAGAADATSDILWFVHTDSKIAPGSLAEIQRTIREGGKTGGNFRVVFDETDGFADWLTGFYAWFRRRGLYYDDSGVFIRRDVYDAIGGMQPMALMEDYDFTRRMERFGGTCCINAPPIVTSSRKFHGRKPIGIVLGWTKIHALCSLGVSRTVW